LLVEKQAAYTGFHSTAAIGPGADLFSGRGFQIAKRLNVSSQDLGQAFLNRESIGGVEYQHNDYVRVIDGPYYGKNGSLVWLFSVETEPMFLVKLDEGGDVELRQSQLSFISHDG
jgi:hypothetical protein